MVAEMWPITFIVHSADVYQNQGIGVNSGSYQTSYINSTDIFIHLLLL